MTGEWLRVNLNRKRNRASSAASEPPRERHENEFDVMIGHELRNPLPEIVATMTSCSTWV